MNRASGTRARYGRPRSRSRFRPGPIAAAAAVGALGVALAYPVLKPNTIEAAALAVLALIPLVIALTVRPGAARGRVIGSAAGAVVVLAAYGALLYTVRFAPHDGYSVSIKDGATISEVEGEVRTIAGDHGLAADTSFSSDRLKVVFPTGDPATIAAAISELRAAPGVASVEACYGTLC